MGNILLVANWESDVGYAWWLMENFWITISEYFYQYGIKSFLIYPKITYIPEKVAHSCITVIEHDFHNHSIKNKKKLRYLVKSKNIKYVYLTDAPFHSALYIYLRALGVKRIIIHDHSPGDRNIPNALIRGIKSVIQHTPYYTADCFIAVTYYVYKRFIDTACLPANKCFCVPNGIQPIDMEHADMQYSQNMFSIPADRIIIVSTGRATYYKGVDFIIKCANELINIRKQYKLHFLYCGDGPDINDFRKLANRYHLEDHFTFAGNRSDIRELLPSCHIGFHAAKGEVGYSLSILEYMSAGLVTIVPDLPSTALAIDDGLNGLVFKHNDITSAVQAILKAVDVEMKYKLGQNAIKTIHSQYNIDRTNHILIKTLIPVIQANTNKTLNK